MNINNFDAGIKTENSLLQAKLNNLNTDARIKTGKIQRDYTAEEKTKLAESARGFESIFVNMMYKSMKAAMLDTVKDSNKDSMTFGADTLSGYTDMAFADEISNSNNGIGIAQMLYQQITGEKLEPNKPNIKLAPVAHHDRHTALNAVFPNTSTVSGQTRNDRNSKNNQPINFNIKGNNNEKATSGNLIERVSQRITPFENIINSAAKQFNLPVSLIKAVITAESAGNVTAKSPVGAKGLMQLMDGTAKDLGVTNSFDPKQNIMGGARYLRQMLNSFNGDLDIALAAYNAGPGNVRKYGGIPPFNETQNYVKKVKQHIKAFTV